MYANHPEMAARWQEHTPSDADLPQRVQSAGNKHKKKKKKPVESAEETKESSYTLSPEQQSAVDRILDPSSKGLILAHSMGTGKSLSSLDAIRKLGQPADVVVPASLRNNYRKEIDKFGFQDVPITLHSLQGLARGKSELTHPIVAIDEAHALRNRGKAYRAIMKSPATKRIALTGTPMVNSTADILPLLQFVSRDSQWNMDPSDFEEIMSAGDTAGNSAEVDEFRKRREDLNKRLSMGKVRGSKRKQIMRDMRSHLTNKLRAAERRLVIENMRKYIDVQDKHLDDMPEVKHNKIVVPMSEEQDRVSRALFNNMPAAVIRKIKLGLPPDRQDFGKINSFLSASRQVMNGDPRMISEASPKIRRAIEDAKRLYDSDPESKWVAYSNFLDSGTNLYKKQLEELGIPYGEFTGDIPDNKRKQIVDDYNNNRIRALIISGAGSEGLDLKGTTMMQLLEPHWNESRLRQAAGRAIRRGSHVHLPPEKRTVDVNSYLSSMSDGVSVDEYLLNLAKDKQRRIDRLKQELAKRKQGIIW